MGLFSKDIKTLDDLFIHGLRDIYYAENQIVDALPDMINKATDPQLKQGFETHLRETQGHVTRLEQVFDMLGSEPRQVDCPAIDGIIELVAWANQLGRNDCASLLEATLEEEKATDKKLTEMAESKVNVRAA